MTDDFDFRLDKQHNLFIIPNYDLITTFAVYLPAKGESILLVDDEEVEE